MRIKETDRIKGSQQLRAKFPRYLCSLSFLDHTSIWSCSEAASSPDQKIAEQEVLQRSTENLRIYSSVLDIIRGMISFMALAFSIIFIWGMMLDTTTSTEE